MLHPHGTATQSGAQSGATQTHTGRGEMRRRSQWACLGSARFIATVTAVHHRVPEPARQHQHRQSTAAAPANNANRRTARSHRTRTQTAKRFAQRFDNERQADADQHETMARPGFDSSASSFQGSFEPDSSAQQIQFGDRSRALWIPTGFIGSLAP